EQARLEATVSASERAGAPIRVALIASQADLGSITSLWGRPAPYAQFLGTELSLMYRGPLLVVMPNGVGLFDANGLNSAQRAAVTGVGPPGTGNKLAQEAIAETERLASALGHPLSATAVTASPTPAGHAASTGNAPIQWAVLALGAIGIVAAWTLSLRARPPRVRRGQRSGA
ncbi:MAG: hypothetical protein ACRDL5_13750, partial [Solirubrobacteraceae bacterium]